LRLVHSAGRRVKDDAIKPLSFGHIQQSVADVICDIERIPF
jgi:hypothetical protein